MFRTAVWHSRIKPTVWTGSLDNYTFTRSYREDTRATSVHFVAVELAEGQLTIIIKHLNGQLEAIATHVLCSSGTSPRISKEIQTEALRQIKQRIPLFRQNKRVRQQIRAYVRELPAMYAASRAAPLNVQKIINRRRALAAP
jgi:hypothetical protein